MIFYFFFLLYMKAGGLLDVKKVKVGSQALILKEQMVKTTIELWYLMLTPLMVRLNGRSFLAVKEVTPLVEFPVLFQIICMSACTSMNPNLRMNCGLRKAAWLKFWRRIWMAGGWLSKLASREIISLAYLIEN